MPAIEIEFEWSRDSSGYDLLPEAEDAQPATATVLLGGGSWHPQRVARRGGRLESYRPLERYETLYAQLAKIRDAAGVLDFVTRFGPVTTRGIQKGGYDDVEIVLRHAEAMHLFLRAKDNHAILPRLVESTTKFGQLDFRPLIDPITRAPKLVFVPRHLIGALWLQLGQALAGGASLRQCAHCGVLFEIGPGTRRRLDAKYCSDAHRIAFGSKKRGLAVGT